MSEYQKIAKALLEKADRLEVDLMDFCTELIAALKIMDRLPEYEHRAILWAVLGIPEEKETKNAE